MKELNLLMLESDEHDRELSAAYFDERGISYRFVKYSHEVINYLNSKVHLREDVPGVILLSLHAVPDTGFKVLTELKSDERFKHIPVVILGENTIPEMVKQCYAGGANSFINKPFNNDETRFKINAFLD